MVSKLSGLSEVKFMGSGEVLEEIGNCFKQSKNAKIAVAYLGSKGLDNLLKRAKDFLTNKNRLQLLVGLSSYRVTEWQALEKLLTLKKQLDNIEIRCYCNEGFHPKIFVFDAVNEFNVIIGSSNLTFAGLTKNIEANVLLRITDQSFKTYQEVIFYWNCLWTSADPLSEEIVSKYKASFSKKSLKNDNKSEVIRTPLPNVPPFGDLKKGSNVLFWKIAPGKQGCVWSEWKKAISDNRGYIAIGWSALGDLKTMCEYGEKEFKKNIKRRIKATYDSNPNYTAGQFWRFCCEMKNGQGVVCYSKKTIFGIGFVDGDYFFEGKDQHYPHRRAVKWIALPGVQVQKRIWCSLATNNVINAVRDPNAIGYLNGLV